MTTGPDPQDPHIRELADAWRAQSRESPPPALDAAILAAAHRAVGSTPQAAGAQALRPPRWWMPFAAAAVIGVVAVGVVQLVPHDPAIDVSSGQGARQEMAAAPAAAPDASHAAVPATGSAQADEGERPHPAAAAAVAQTRPKLAATRPPVAEAKPDAAPPTPSVAAAPAPAPATAPPAARGQASAPEPFPAAPPAAPSAAQPSAAQPSAAQPSAAQPSAAQPSAAQPFSRDVPSRTDRLVPVPAELPRKDAAAAASSDATPAERLRGIEPQQMMPGLTGAAPMPKESVPIRAEALTLAKDPDAWIIRIRKLRDGGRTTDAVEELREFDALVPDAQQRMPSELRRFMERETVKR